MTQDVYENDSPKCHVEIGVGSFAKPPLCKMAQGRLRVAFCEF